MSALHAALMVLSERTRGRQIAGSEERIGALITIEFKVSVCGTDGEVNSPKSLTMRI